MSGGCSFGFISVVGGQTGVPPQFLMLSIVCPHCIRANLNGGTPAYERAVWRMATCSFCPRHRTPLVQVESIPQDIESCERDVLGLNNLEQTVAAIVLWNTVYLERAVDSLRLERSIDDTLLPHLSPLGWEHIHLTGDYVWHANRRVGKGRHRPLRTPKSPSPGT